MNLAIKTCYLCTGRCGRTEFQLPFDKWEALLLQAHVIGQILTGPLSFRSDVRTAKLDSAGLDWASSLVVVIQSFSYSHISSLRWRMLLTSSGTPTQIISVISNVMWYRTAEYWQETEGDLFVRSGSLVLLHLSFFFPPEFVVGTVLTWASNIIGECTQASHTGEGDTWSQLPLVGIIGLKCTGGRRRLNMALTLRKQWLLIEQSWQDRESFYWIRR